MSVNKDEDLITFNLKPGGSSSVEDNDPSKCEYQLPNFQVPTDIVDMSNQVLNHSVHDKTDDTVNISQTISKSPIQLLSNKVRLSEKGVDINQTCESRRLLKSHSNGGAQVIYQAETKHSAKRGVIFPVTAEAELESIEGDVGSNIEGAMNDSSRNHAIESNPFVIAMENKPDMFCWRCHKISATICCTKCPRSYHGKCLKNENFDLDNWNCPECSLIAEAENSETRNETLRKMPRDHLCYLFRFALSRMIKCQGAEPFMQPVSEEEFPEYKKYIIQPMDLETLKNNIKNLNYNSPQSFEADAKWILHNSIIFNSTQSKLTSIAKAIMKICKHEMSELENCPSCYLNANTKKSTWFIEVCPKPHLLVWAKLKGFPFWPAKVMRYNNSQGLVDVGFFGAHDRAWVPTKECYLFCEKDPNTFKPKRYDIEECLKEMNFHIDNLRKIYGQFRYAEFKTLIDPNNESEQLKILLPNYKSRPYLESSFINNYAEMKELESEKSGSDESDIENGEAETVNESLDDNSKNVSLDKIFDSSNVMEGYGTDDESIVMVDSDRRKIYNKRLTDPSENNEIKMIDRVNNDDEDDDEDTQVPNNISVDTWLSDKNSSEDMETKGKKMPLRRKSEVAFGSSRLLDYCPKNKISRRNSDISIKTDSSRISGVSEKISWVDIKENMEISLGVIPENISPHNGISRDSGQNVELKRKPVQVDIDNAEFSISPTNKLKITETLFKRLTDDKDKVNNAVEEAKRKTQENGLSNPNRKDNIKSGNIFTTDMALQNSDAESSEDIEVDVSKQSGILKKQEELVTKSFEPPESIPEFIIEKQNEKHSKTSPEHSTEDNLDILSGLSTDLNSIQKNMIQPSITEFTTKHVSNNSSCSKSFSSEKEQVKDIDKSLESRETSNRSQINGMYSLEPSELSLDTEESLVTNIQMDKFDLFNIIHSSLNNEKDLKKAVVISRDTIIEPLCQDIATEDDELMDDPLEEIQDKLENDTNLENKSIVESNQYASGDLVIQLLNYGKPTNEENEDIVASEITGKEKSTKSSPVKDSASDGALGEIRVKNLPKECDRSGNEVIRSDISSNAVRRPSSEGKSKSGVKRKLSHGSSPENHKKVTSNTSNSNYLPHDEIVIKSEPECSDDDFTELEEDLEQKKKYLSALNISERTDNQSTERKLNQIRTRSKAEEKRAKFLAFDNISKTIDEVATNYSALHDGEIFGKRKELDNNDDPKRSLNSSTKLRTLQPGQRARKSFPAPIYSVAAGSDMSKTSGHNTYLRVVQQPNHIKSARTTATSASEPNSNVPHVILLHPTSLVNSVYDRPTSTTYTNSVCQSTTSSQRIVPSSSKSSLLMTQILQPLVRQPIFIQKQNKIQTGNSSLLRNKLTTIPPNTHGSQNYIPLQKNSVTTACESSPRIVLNEHIQLPGTLPNNETSSPHMPTISSAPSTSQDNNYILNTNPNTDMLFDGTGDNYTDLQRLLPENLGQALSKILLKPAPKPKPRPPSMLSQRFDTGTPSSAGEVTSKINSIAHRMTDYFRGMLIETIEDFGTKNVEGKVVSLELEIERLKHQHKQEMEDTRGNFTKILNEIQHSLAKDREELEERVRSECEAEAIKRIELAKSKQWCANCSKEAQFYCCWNTSYCDYPCQQKHWTQHMKNCTQHLEKSSTKASPAHPRKSMSKNLAKPGMALQRLQIPNKVYPRASGITKIKASAGSRVAVIKPAPGNLDIQDVAALKGNDYPLRSTVQPSIIRVDSPSPPQNPEI